MSEAQSVESHLQKQYRRLVPTEEMLSQLKPWLDYRVHYAKKLEDYRYTPARSHIESVLDECDQNIKEILGL